MPVISSLVYTVTDSTIVATWTTDTSSDSNLSAGGQAAIDNGVAAAGTSHQCICANLLPNTTYSCVVTSGGTSSSPQNVTTAPVQGRTLVTGAQNSGVTNHQDAPLGDTFRSLVASDGNTYMTQDDGNGFVQSTPNSGYNTQLAVITDEVNMRGTLISLANYGVKNSTNGTDGPLTDAMSNKSTGLFSINGNLHAFVYRQYPPTYTTNRYCNWIKSTNHGATWNNFTALSTFTAAGNPVTPNSPSEPIQFYVNTIGIVTPVLYNQDDGTLGYNSTGNQIDGANAYVYCSFVKDNTPLYLLRIPRIQFDAQTSSAFEYWVGPSSPAVADFVNQANWSSSPTSATVILSTALAGAWWQIAFVPGINSYIMTTWGSGTPSGSNTQVYSAPTPAGPWKLIFQQQNPVLGSVWYGIFPFHRDLIGNTKTDSIPVRIIYQGEAASPSNNYRPNISTLTLFTSNHLLNKFVQGAGTTVNSGTVASLALAFPNNTVSGDLLVVCIRYAIAGTLTNVTSTCTTGNWTIVYNITDGGGTVKTAWAYAFATSSGPNTVTANFSPSAGAQMVIAEYNGPSSFRASSAFANATSTVATTNAATAFAGDLVIGFVELAGGGVQVTAGTGYNLRAAGVITGTSYVFIQDNLNASAGSTTAALTNFSSTSWGAGIGIFAGPVPVPGGGGSGTVGQGLIGDTASLGAWRQING